MSEFRFDQVKVLVIDPNRMAASSIEGILKNCGFRDVRRGSSFEDLKTGTQLTVPDLLICEVELEGGDVCQWIRDLRHHRTGQDPFLPVLGTAWNPKPELVKRVMEAGADGLVTKPLSTDALVSRIRGLVRARKPFVVTSDYVGPDRYRSGDRPSKVKLLDVPNRLQALTEGRSLGNEEMDRAISQALEAVNLQKIERQVERVGESVDRVLPLLDGRADTETVSRELGVLAETAEDIGNRMAGTSYDHVAGLCRTLQSVARGIRRAPEKAASRDVKLLKPLAQAIGTGLAGAASTAAAAREILQTIDENVLLDAETSKALEEAEPQGKVASERRTKFLLRLLAGRISHLLSNHTGRRQIIPRSFLRGFDEYLLMLLGEKLYADLNPRARALLEKIGSDDDSVIWKAIAGNDEYRSFADTILLHVLLKFSNFARGKRNFMGIVNRVIAETLRASGKYAGRDGFTENHFVLVFATLFSDIFSALAIPEGRERLDALVGPGTADTLDAIHRDYERDKERAAAQKPD